MNERGNRGRSGHGVRQPDIQRKLCGLATGADKQQQTDGRRRAGVVQRLSGSEGEHSAVVRGAEGVEDQENAEDEAEVADAIDDERFLSGVGGKVLVVVEPDQKIRAETDAFPPDEHDDVVRAEHQHQHHEHEEVQIREEARVAGLVRHVADGVDVNQEPDPRHDHQHRRGEWIDAKGEIDREIRQKAAGHVPHSGGNPGEVRVIPSPARRQHEHCGDEGGEEGRRQREKVRDRLVFRLERSGESPYAVDQRADRRKQRHEQKQTSHSVRSPDPH